MARYPGATYKPTPHGGRVKRNRQGRGILHVAVNRHQELAPWDDNTWHLYVGLTAPDGSTDGSGGPAVCTQYVDTDFRAYGNVDANDDAIVVETAGGTGSSKELNAEPWNRAQQLRIIDLMRWEAKQPDGAPLQLLPDSRAGRKGWGPHRLGIQHSAGLVPGWWSPGGEKWSSKLGKECPGDAKVAQVPGLIAEARTGSPLEEDDMAGEGPKILALLEQMTGKPDPKKRWDDRIGALWVQNGNVYKALSGQIAGLNAAVVALAAAVAKGDGLAAAELRAAVDQGVQDGIMKAGASLREIESAAQ